MCASEIKQLTWLLLRGSTESGHPVGTFSNKAAKKVTLSKLDEIDTELGSLGEVVEVKISLEILAHTIRTLLTFGLTLRASCSYGKSFLAGCMINHYLPEKK